MNKNRDRHLRVVKGIEKMSGNYSRELLYRGHTLRRIVDLEHELEAERLALETQEKRCGQLRRKLDRLNRFLEYTR